jgi:hypothetical protein
VKHSDALIACVEDGDGPVLESPCSLYSEQLKIARAIGDPENDDWIR